MEGLFLQTQANLESWAPSLSTIPFQPRTYVLVSCIFIRIPCFLSLTPLFLPLVFEFRCPFPKLLSQVHYLHYLVSQLSNSYFKAVCSVSLTITFPNALISSIFQLFP